MQKYETYFSLQDKNKGLLNRALLRIGKLYSFLIMITTSDIVL